MVASAKPYSRIILCMYSRNYLCGTPCFPTHFNRLFICLPARPSFIFRTQMNTFFLWNLRDFWPCIDHNVTEIFKLKNIFLLQNSNYSWYWRNERLTLKRIICWIKALFLFSLSSKYSRSFIKLQLNHWYHMDYFNDVLTTFLGLGRFCCILKMNGLAGLEQHEGE